jgi:hypothetical protein
MALLDNIFLELQKIMDSIVIKYDKEAKQYETIDSIIDICRL